MEEDHLSSSTDLLHKLIQERTIKEGLSRTGTARAYASRSMLEAAPNLAQIREPMCVRHACSLTGMGALNAKRAREKEEVPKVVAKEERKALESRSKGHRLGGVPRRIGRRSRKGW